MERYERYSRSVQRKKSNEQPGDRVFALLCFQISVCLVVTATFFSAVKAGGESERTATAAAQFLCGRSAAVTMPKTEEMVTRIRDILNDAEDELKGLAQSIEQELAGKNNQPTEPMTVGESGSGGPLPKDELMTAAAGATLAPYQCTASFCSPTAGKVTSPFGWRSHPISGEKDFHKGVDIAAAEGTPVLAALPGVVEETGYSESYGNFVVMRHSQRLRTTYNHCSEILAHEGEQLSRGDRIALVGSTGLSTGPHLHFEVEVDGLKADPLISLKTIERAAQ